MKQMMNKYVGIALVTFAGVFTLSSCDKDDDHITVNPPQEVMQVFAAQYPDVNPRWDFEWGNYEAEFFYSGTHGEWNMPMNNVETEAFYTAGGKWIRTTFDVTNYYYVSEDQVVIPAAVRQTIQQYAAGGKHVDDVKIYDMPQGETDYYRVEIDNDPNDIYVSIQFDGTLLP